MTISLKTLKKWQKDFGVLGHPTRLAILFMLYGVEVLEKQKKKEKLWNNFCKIIANSTNKTKTFRYSAEFYFKTLREARTIIKISGLRGLLWLFLIWPIKFAVYLKIGKGILFPFSVEGPT